MAVTRNGFSGYASSGFNVRQVTIEELVPSRGLIICKEISTGRPMEVPLLPVRVRVPRVGEQWLLDRAYGPWSFAAIVSDVKPEVSGDRSTADPVTLSLLDAMVSLGLVVDKTV
jgi:hypothetical protein